MGACAMSTARSRYQGFADLEPWSRKLRHESSPVHYLSISQGRSLRVDQALNERSPRICANNWLEPACSLRSASRQSVSKICDRECSIGGAGESVNGFAFPATNFRQKRDFKSGSA